MSKAGHFCLFDAPSLWLRLPNPAADGLPCTSVASSLRAEPNLRRFAVDLATDGS